MLWRDPEPTEPDRNAPDAVLSIGEVALLAGLSDSVRAPARLSLPAPRRGAARPQRAALGTRPGGAGELRGFARSDRGPRGAREPLRLPGARRRVRGRARCPAPGTRPSAVVGGRCRSRPLVSAPSRQTVFYRPRPSRPFIDFTPAARPRRLKADACYRPFEQMHRSPNGQFL